MPTELDELERRRIQLEIEREALRKEKDDASKSRLETLERELADLSERARCPEEPVGTGKGRHRRLCERPRPSWKKPSTRSRRPSGTPTMVAPQS